ncbi:MAG: U32 family peptidase, partial [Eubacteriales bacterium]|nr:U32 family peptidase [Eubacteriales bacterium]
MMNDTRSLELLAPAGGYEQLRAAVENGADAVYLGGRMHNARQNAANFDDDMLTRALEYAHARGVPVHITLNTLIAPEEFDETLRYAAHLYTLGADALIVQDLGLARALRALLPDLPLHLSTQGTVCDAHYAALAAQMGFSRVILARETALADIRAIAAASPIPVEVFVHGALCVCISGQCLFSSLVGGRSGNRGQCAQPCRLPYTLLKDGVAQASGYLLSPKDNCAVEYLEQLRAAGVASLK